MLRVYIKKGSNKTADPGGGRKRSAEWMIDNNMARHGVYRAQGAI